MDVINEIQVPELVLQGRFMRWLVNNDAIKSENISACVIRVLPGESVLPAHSHPHSEEFIYIISGSGKVMIEESVSMVEAGSGVLFRKGKVHILKNSGAVEMKVICFFAPATSLDNYHIVEGVVFPE